MRFVVFGLLIVVGCASAPYSTHPVVMDNDPILAERVRAAVEALNRVTAPGTFTFDEGQTHWARRVDVYRDEDPGRFFSTQPDVVAFTEFDGNNVSVALSSAATKAAIAHELGHAAGLDHVDDSNNLMYYRPVAWVLTPEQIATIMEAR